MFNIEKLVTKKFFEQILVAESFHHVDVFNYFLFLVVPSIFNST